VNRAQPTTKMGSSNKFRGLSRLWLDSPLTGLDSPAG
jgi:hypothetical protein